MTSDMEVSSVAVHRIKMIVDEPSEEDDKNFTADDDYKELDWMKESSITCDDVTMRYSEDGPAALSNLSIEVKSGERVGSQLLPCALLLSLTRSLVVGRSGSGKSSLLAALFRLYEIQSGSITIGQVDTKSLPRQTLRHGLTLISQEAMLLCCSLREVCRKLDCTNTTECGFGQNLDPEGIYEDVQIWEALETAHCRAFVEGLPDKLDHQIAAGGAAISRGTRQLLALARALCKPAYTLSIWY